MADGEQPCELEHAIGFSALRGGLHYHPNGREYVYAAGAAVVVADFNDAHAQTFLRGHDGPVTCVALSRQGSLVCSGQHGENADAIVWSFADKSLLFRLSEHDHEVAAAAFSEDELLLCTCGGVNDGKLIVWDMSNGYKVTAVSLDPSPVTCVAFGGFVRDVKRRDTSCYQLATCGSTRVVLWSLDARTGAMAGDRVAVDGRGCAVRQFTWLEFGEDLETLYCTTTSGDLTLVNVRKKTTVGGAAVFAAKSGVQALLCSRAGVFAGGGDGTVTSFDEKLHDSAQAQLDGAVVALSFSPDRTELVAGTATGSIYRLRADLSAALLVCENHAKAVSCVAYAEGESSEKFATASLDRTVRVWDANDYKCSASVSVRDAGDPQCVVYSLDFLISGWTDGRIRAHDAESARPLWTIDHAHRGGVTALVLSHNARFVMTGGGEGDVRVWELRSRELVSHLKEHRAAVTGLALYADDVHALSCSRDRSFLCWDLRREKRMTSHTQRMGGINSIALGTDETSVFTVGQEKRLTSWDLREPNATRAIDLSKDNSDEATSVAVSHDGRVVATAGSNMELKLWSSDNLSPIAVVHGHSGAINDLKFSPDDKQLVSVGEDGVIFVWNLFL